MNLHTLFITCFVLVGASLVLFTDRPPQPVQPVTHNLQTECKQRASVLSGDAATRIYQHCITLGTL